MFYLSLFIFFGTFLLALVIFKRKRREILLVFISLTFATLVSETFLRLFLPQVMEHNDMFEFDPHLGWKFVPEKEGTIIYSDEVRNFIKINEMGFRDKPFDTGDQRKKKIMVLGDSFVSNISVKDHEVFTEVIEERLPDVEVLNFGVNGYGQVQEYLLMEKWFDKVQPDLILLVIYLRNDFTDNLGEYWLYPRPFATLNPEDSSVFLHPISSKKSHTGNHFQKFYQKLHLFALIKRVVTNSNPEAGMEILPDEFTPPESYLCLSPFSEETNRMYRTMEALLLKFKVFADQKNVPLVVALAPSIVQMEEILWKVILERYDRGQAKYDKYLPNRILMEFANQNDLQMIDLTHFLQSENAFEYYNKTEQHWNKKGNKVVGCTLASYLKTRRFIE